PKMLIMMLPQDCTYAKVACIAHKLKGQIPVGGNQDWSFSKFFLQRLESLNTFIGEDERGVFLKEMSHRSGNFGKILNESSVETDMTEKTPNTLDGGRMR
ncbi:hypothetical protein Tco_0447682, partial [Tanacetum coccineum]